MDCGVPITAFWESSIPEIEDLIDSFYRMERQREKLRIGQLFILAEAVATRVAFSFSPKEDRDSSLVLQPWDIYPELFAVEKKQAGEAEEDQEFLAFKAARKRYAAEFNKRRRGWASGC